MSKNKDSKLNIFGDLKSKIKKDENQSHKIPSILDFVKEKKYLSDPPINLYPVQELVLKCFYRGSFGNEDLQLTEKDIELINSIGLNDPKNGNLIDKWNSNNQFRELVLVWGRRCLSEDSEIIDVQTGKVWSFRDMWNCGAEKVHSWTYNEANKSMVLIGDCNIIKQEKREVFQVKMASGHEIEATENHPFLTSEGWKDLKDLRPKDKIAICSYQPFFGTSSEITEDEASVLGYLSRSCCDSIGNYIATTFTDNDIVTDFKNKLFSIASDTKIESADKVNLSNVNKKYSYFATQKTSKEISFKVINFLVANGIKNKTGKEKFVPTRIFSSPKNVVSAYLRSFFSCNSVFNKSVTKIETQMQSGFLAKQIQHLLSRFGIFAHIKEKVNKESLDYYIVISKNSHVKRFVNEIGFVGKQEEINAINESLHNSKIDEIIFIPIVSIKKIGIKQTYDIQVSDKPELQNFVSNGFICHNSGKDYICSIIALYEAMRLLETPGGNPYDTYGLGMADPFTILCIANSSSQAKILFRQIKDKVLNSEYFKDKILPEGITSDGIHFLTPEDKRRNKELVEKGFAPNLGSIVVRAGHSNSDSLVGISCYVLLLDEIGIYKNTAGSSSGDAIFNSLAPAVATYVRSCPVKDKDGKIALDENGKEIYENIYDGKIICLSTPRGKEGIFYNLYQSHVDVSHRLVCRAATWEVNPRQTKESLLKMYPDMPEEKFLMEYGAEFSGTAGENFFAEENVENCFADKSMQFRAYGVPGMVYFAHLDPATSSHNYALVIAHKESFFNEDIKQRDWRIIVDHIKYWSPSPGKPISVEEVDDYVVGISKRFHIGVVTYDHFNSQSSIAKLRRFGIPSRMTPFTKQYKNIIYNNLNQIVINGKIHIPYHALLKNEMKHLQRKWLDSGFKVYPKREGDVTTDDIVDALAGVCYNCIEKDINKLPKGKTVLSPESSVISGQVWRSMQGTPYGFGSGEQVARNLEQRSSYPRR
jgi:intein/homing endonuclease